MGTYTCIAQPRVHPAPCRPSDSTRMFCTLPAQLALKDPCKEAAKRRVRVLETLLQRYQRARLAMHTHCYPNPWPLVTT